MAWRGACGACVRRAAGAASGDTTAAEGSLTSLAASGAQLARQGGPVALRAALPGGRRGRRGVQAADDAGAARAAAGGAARRQCFDTRAPRSRALQDYARFGIEAVADKQKLFKLIRSLQPPPPPRAPTPPRVYSGGASACVPLCLRGLRRRAAAPRALLLGTRVCRARAACARGGADARSRALAPCGSGGDDAAWRVGLLDVHALEDADLLGEVRQLRAGERRR
jgi:hypothetical protein